MPTISTLSAASVRILDFWPVTSGATIASVSVQTATVYEVVLSNGSFIRYTGTGFAYAGVPPLPTAGSYSTVEIFDPAHASVASMTGATGNLALILSGDPSVAVLAANDTITGGQGDDVLVGRGGDDTITDLFGAVVNIDAGAGKDLIQVNFNSFSGGSIEGGAGQDSLVAMNDISNVSIFGVETLVTTGFATNAKAAQFDAFDRIVQSVVNSTDVVNLQVVSSGTATVLDLSDELAFAGGARAVVLTGSADNENFTTGLSADRLNAGDGNDTVQGGAGADSVAGNGGDDSLFGQAGNDTILGEAGNDALFGGDNNDRLVDDAGTTTTMDGGLGDDRI